MESDNIEECRGVLIALAAEIPFASIKGDTGSAVGPKNKDLDLDITKPWQ
jgi:hypothetical protein